ncbi:MAG: SAM-dependent methyltransferase [Desulfuromonadales bacterium]|nr:SAM-dependent methyltransferase [Desulfuromonadales bacterium]
MPTALDCRAMETSPVDSPLAAELRGRIAETGGLPFAEFMAACLYHPQFGYYMTPRERIGKCGDFFTSSSVHAVFGRLVARQLAQMAKLLGGEVFQIVEQGPGEGHLALDILDALASETPDLYGRLTYTLVEVGQASRARQARTLAAHAEKIAWCAADEWRIESGCFLSNELVDAFPVHVVEKHGGELREVHVVNGTDGSFDEELRDPSTPALAEHFRWLGSGPVEGNRAEANLAAPVWMRQVSECIDRGFIITIDYGYPAAELYALHRRTGTLLCYQQHQADDNPYTAVGEKDITAHVDFTALQRAGEEVGLTTLWFGEQYRFLLGLGFFEELLRLQEQCTDEREARALRLTLKNLILPEQGMGETFKVLVQGQGVGAPELLCTRPISSIPIAALAAF